MVVKLIGFVRTKAREREVWADRENVVSEVGLNEKLAPALDGIEAYSYVIVLFWMQLVTKRMRAILKMHPLHKRKRSKVGIFALRERNRPNPIGLTVVELLERKENTLKVRGLDALGGTPVLDVKPYYYGDAKKEIRVPEWMLKGRAKTHS